MSDVENIKVDAVSVAAGTLKEDDDFQPLPPQQRSFRRRVQELSDGY
jgi:hypothetical protein